MFIRSMYNYDRDAVSLETGLACSPESRTQQNFKEECDINTIVRRFNITGQLPDNVRAPSFIDYEGVFDFQTAMNTMMQTEEAFMKMPAAVRREFNNDPQEFLAFCDAAPRHPEMADKAIKMGLAVARPAPVEVKPTETSSST